MKSIKKLLVLFMAVLMCLSLCVACGNDDTGSKDKKDRKEKVEDDADDEDDEDDDDEDEAEDDADAGQDEVSPILQMVIYSNTKADFIIANAYIEEGSGGESGVVFKTSSEAYDVGLYDRNGLECEVAEGSDPSDTFGGMHTPVGDCSYSYNGDTLTISVDMSDYGIDFDFHNVTDLVLCNGPEGNGWGPGFFTAADVLKDECSSHDAADRNDNDDDDTDVTADNSSVADMDFSGEYTLSGESDLYFTVEKGTYWKTGEDGYKVSFDAEINDKGYVNINTVGDYPYYKWIFGLFDNGVTYDEGCSFELTGGDDLNGGDNFGEMEGGHQTSYSHKFVLNTDGSITLTVSCGQKSITGTFVKK